MGQRSQAGGGMWPQYGISAGCESPISGAAKGICCGMGGYAMPFSFASPEDLVQLEKSFEAAWAVIVERHGCDPLSASGRRERLAYILASLWRQGVQVQRNRPVSAL